MMSIMIVFVVFGIGYLLFKYYKVEVIYGGVVVFVSFLILMLFFFNSFDGEFIIGVFLLD